MATQTQILLTDDLTGDAADETVSFAFEGTQYEIDLSDKNAKEMRDALSRYVAAARTVSRARGRAASTTGKSSGTGMSKDELAKVRSWAAANGVEVAERGRIAKSVIEQYQAANA